MSGGLDLLHARVAFRDRPVVDVLDLSLRFIVAHLRIYAIVTAWTVLPAFALSLASARVWDWDAAWLVAIALGLLVQTPFTVLASRLVFEEGVRAREVVGHALRRTPLMAFARIVLVLAIALAGSFCILPGLWVMTALYFLTEVMLLERAGLGVALQRAQRLATASTGDVVLALVLLSLVTVTAVVLSDVAGRGVIEEVLQFRPPKSLFDEGGSVLSFLGFFVAMPFVATARFFTYLNVRTRAEGWDIQTRFAAIATREAER